MAAATASRRPPSVSNLREEAAAAQGPARCRAARRRLAAVLVGAPPKGATYHLTARHAPSQHADWMEAPPKGG